MLNGLLNYKHFKDCFIKFRVQLRNLDIKVITLIFIVALVVNWKTLLDGLILSSHDIWHHTRWVKHFSKQLLEGILYPRWLAGNNFGYGSPTFVFYPPLIYYIGSFINMAGLSLERTMSCLLTFATFGIGLSFYIYGRQQWKKIPSLIGAIFYMTAPYITLNLYIRGALPETWSLMYIPLIFGITRLSIKDSKCRIGLTLIASILALTHVPSLLILTIVWILYLLIVSSNYKIFLVNLAFIIIGFGLVSFYLLPAILEQSFVSIEVIKQTSGGFTANLVGSPTPHSFMSLINKHYFYSVLLAFCFIALNYWSNWKKNIKEYSLHKWIIFVIVIAFLISNISLPIWQVTPLLQKIQFPWRLLGLFYFGLANLLSILMNKIKLKKNYFILTIIVMVICTNLLYVYRSPKDLSTLNKPRVTGSKAKQSLQKIDMILNQPDRENLKGVPEYLPLSPITNLPVQPRRNQSRLSVIEGKARTEIMRWDSYHREFKIIADSDSSISVRTYYYPAWNLYINGKHYPITKDNEGRINFIVESGESEVELYYQWTDAFMIGTILSFLSFMFCLYLLNTKSFYLIN